MASKKKNKKITTTVKSQQEQAKAARPLQKRYFAGKPLLPGKWQINAGIFLLFVIATVIFYSGDLHLGFFAVDDPQYVVNDPWIKGMNGKNLNFILNNPYFANYSPLHLFSYMIDYSFAGLDAHAFHLSSNLWAGVVAGFVFLVALALTSNRIIAIASAVLFVVHPSHVEAVAWISSRKDLVAVAFALPSLLAYLYYRRSDSKKWLWYLLSLILFLFAIAGKLSVATFPAVFLAIDLFIEKRPLQKSILDKIPYIIIAFIFASIVSKAQPEMGNPIDPFVLMQAALQNLWLSAGFGTYVLYRVAPEHGSTALQLAGVVGLLLLFAAPYLLRRKWPLVAVLIYWMLFAFIPSQVLSFTHPVTDRYLFFPSVGFVILLSWAIITIAKRYGQKAMIGSLAVLGVIAFFWAMSTLNYLNEWKDPRSVWYSAERKSHDPTIPQNLGSYYVDLSRKFNPGSTDSLFPQKEDLAKLIWANDPRLPKLISEWKAGQKGGPMEKEFQEQIRTLALDAFQKAIQSKGNRVMPGIYYNRGSILLDRGDLEGARKEFQLTLDESARESFAETRVQLTVYSYYGLGIIEFKEGKYANSKDWFQKAYDAQKSFGGNWIPSLPNDIKNAEQAAHGGK